MYPVRTIFFGNKKINFVTPAAETKAPQEDGRACLRAGAGNKYIHYTRNSQEKIYHPHITTTRKIRNADIASGKTIYERSDITTGLEAAAARRISTTVKKGTFALGSITRI